VACLAIILALLYTNIIMLQESQGCEINWVEFISFRTGFTIYSGWVTAATILNFSFVLKAGGLRDGNNLTHDEA